MTYWDDSTMWHEQLSNNYYRSYIHGSRKLFCLVSKTIFENDDEWLHISISRRDRVPNWDELKMAKDHFIGLDKEAISMLPKKEDYVNLHPYCLHLWAPLKSDVMLPNLTKIKLETAHVL